MKIKKVVLHKVDLPMHTPFKTSFGTVSKRPTLIVEVHSDRGHVGWGESAALPYPNYKPETTDICMLVLKDYIVPLILNKNLQDAEELMSKLTQVKNHRFAKTGLETAFWMILSLQSGLSLKRLVGGTKNKIPVGESIGVKDSIEETLEEIALRNSQGFKRAKIKIEPGWDIKVVDSIRQKFGNIDLTVDANSAYTLKDLDIFKRLDKYNLTMIEQPLADDDIIDHSVLQKKIKTPICLDESILSAEDARRAIYLKACKVINIKPGRVGGLLESKKIHDLCKKHKVGVWCGGMLETGIGRAYNIAISSLPNYRYPNDMSPANFYFKDDLVKDSFVVDKDGFIDVSDKPGLGFEVDEKKIKKYTVDKVILS